MTRKHWLFAPLSLLLGSATIACGDDSTSSTGTDTETESTTSTTTTTTSTTTDTTTETTTDTTTTTTTTTGSTTDPTVGTESGSTSTTGPLPPDMAEFTVTIDNLSENTWYPTPFSPVVWVEHTLGSAPMFAVNAAASPGLVLLAEDGDPSALATELDGAADVVSVGTYDVPETAGGMGPIAPGDSYVFNVTAQQGSRLSFGSMLVESNDIFLGTGPQGVSLFTNSGFPQEERDVTVNLEFWEAGSEANQAPLGGDYQAPRQGAAGYVGADESGVVSVRSESTHQLPQAPRIARVDVTYDVDLMEFTITIDNLGTSIASDLSGAVWAQHDDTVSLFTPGMTADNFTGLEALAEDGDPAAWEAAIAGAVGNSGVTAGAAAGGSITVVVPQNATNPLFSFSTMVVDSNDAFLGNAEGVALLNDQGMPRPTADIEDDFERLLLLWDAGTEVNETPGAGPNTGANQNIAGSGTAEAVAIGYYNDATNDLDLATLLTSLDIQIVNDTGGNTHLVSIDNNSLGAAFEFVATPVPWAVHDGNLSVFAVDSPASLSLEMLAEDGDQSMVASDFAGDAAVSQTDVNDGVDLTAIAPGENVTFGISADATNRFLTLLTMVVPSNDTFVALEIDLFDNADQPLDDGALATAIATAVNVYDAGTEANQPGAAGTDMAPGTANTGADEGSGTIQAANDKDASWWYPEPADVVRVTIAPVVQ